MTVTDVDDDICHCVTGRRYPYEDNFGVRYVAFLVELDHISVWMCSECLIGLEEW